MIIVPFKNRPAQTIQDSSNPYTVPVGRYARAVVTLRAEAYITGLSQSSGIRTNNASNVYSDCQNKSVEIWLNEGDVLSKSTSTFTGDLLEVTFFVSASNGDVKFDSGSSTATASVLLNRGAGATTYSSVVSSLSGYYSAVSVAGGSDNGDFEVSGSAAVNWHIEEYYKLT